MQVVCEISLTENVFVEFHFIDRQRITLCLPALEAKGIERILFDELPGYSHLEDPADDAKVRVYRILFVTADRGQVRVILFDEHVVNLVQLERGGKLTELVNHVADFLHVRIGEGSFVYIEILFSQNVEVIGRESRKFFGKRFIAHRPAAELVIEQDLLGAGERAR